MKAEDAAREEDPDEGGDTGLCPGPISQTRSCSERGSQLRKHPGPFGGKDMRVATFQEAAEKKRTVSRVTPISSSTRPDTALLSDL